MRPDIDDLVVALAVRHQALRVLVLDFLDLLLGLGQDFRLVLRHLHVVDSDGDSGRSGELEAHVHQAVGEDHGLLEAGLAIAGVDELADLALVHRAVDQLEVEFLRQQRAEQGAAHRGLDQLAAGAQLDRGVQVGGAGLVGAVHLVATAEHHALAARVDALAGHVVNAQHHVLRGNDHRLAVGRRQDVVRGHHQGARLELRLQRQRHVHGHLVAVEVGVEGGADQRVELYGLALDQQRLEGLDAEAMQGGRAVQEHRVLADHLFEEIPDDRLLALDQAARGLHRGGLGEHLKLRQHEGLEQLQRHLLGQAALVQLERGAHHDDRAARVVHALAQQVLAEAALLALDHVGQRLERALLAAGEGAAAAAVVQQRVDGFLEHALFVAHDDFRRVEVQQPAQAVVAVDDPAVEVVQVGGGETPALQRHQRPQFRRQHRQPGQDHPLRPVAGIPEGLEQLEPLGQALDLGFRTGGVDFAVYLFDGFIEVHLAQQLADRRGAHLGLEGGAVHLQRLALELLGQELALLQVGVAGVGHDEGLEIQHPLDLVHGHVEHQPDARGQRLQKPDMRNRRGQVDVAHALAAHPRLAHLHAALLADHAAVLEALVLAAYALEVLQGAEDAGAEKAVALGLEGPVVDGFGLAYFAPGPRLDHFRGRESDRDGIEVFKSGGGLGHASDFSHASLLCVFVLMNISCG